MPAQQGHLSAQGRVLRDQICQLSSDNSKESWEQAKKEWVLDHIFFAEKEDPEKCLCGHRPIIECCVLANDKTAKEAIVIKSGTTCSCTILHSVAVSSC
jgi:hypothetical protein